MLIFFTRFAFSVSSFVEVMGGSLNLLHTHIKKKDRESFFVEKVQAAMKDNC